MSKCLIAEYETMIAAKACLETLGSVLVIVHDVDKNALDAAGSLLEATKPISLEKHELETTP